MFKQAMMKFKNIIEKVYVHTPDGHHGQKEFDF